MFIFLFTVTYSSIYIYIYLFTIVFYLLYLYLYLCIFVLNYIYKYFCFHYAYSYLCLYLSSILHGNDYLSPCSKPPIYLSTLFTTLRIYLKFGSTPKTMTNDWFPFIFFNTSTDMKVF